MESRRTAKTTTKTTSTSSAADHQSPNSHHHRSRHDRLRQWSHHREHRSTDSRKRKCLDSETTTASGPAPRRRTLFSSARYEDLPADVLLMIAAPFDVPTLRAAGMVCWSWWVALRPLREGMRLFLQGKRFKHGRCKRTGYKVNIDLVKALDLFVMAVERGSALAMVDAGLMYWKMGRKEEGREMYRKAADLGHPAGQYNLAIAYLEDEQPEPRKAVELFYKAAISGYSKAQYNLALCLHYGRGVECNIQEAVTWYMKAAEGGNARAMYNISLCYSLGEEFTQSPQKALLWLERAASSGHRKAQMELGNNLMMSGDLTRALVYFELATRAGETAAAPIRDRILRSLPQKSRDHAMQSVNCWCPQIWRLQHR